METHRCYICDHTNLGEGLSGSLYYQEDSHNKPGKTFFKARGKKFAFLCSECNFVIRETFNGYEMMDLTDS